MLQRPDGRSNSHRVNLEKISFADLADLWPKTDEGRLCSRLLVRYCFTYLVDSMAGATCSADLAQAESGAGKALAKMINDFGTLGTDAPSAPPKKPLQPLRRFQSPDEQQQNSKT